MKLSAISDAILDETSSTEELRDALDAFVRMCSDITGILPDRSFDAWAEDSLLDTGVAINPQAAAHCVVDYQRSVVFLRGVNAAIQALRLRFPDTPIEILYAGCGPFATLLMPLLDRFSPNELQLHCLDIHQRSLDSVNLLLRYFELSMHEVQTIQGDACHYTHPGTLHMVVAETMQKSLEQEPQFAVTANLAPQLSPHGVFIPQRIEVSLCLSDPALNRSQHTERNSPIDGAQPYPLATVCILHPENAYSQMKQAQESAENTTPQLGPIIVEIPALDNIAQLSADLYTRICVFDRFLLQDSECEITLPLKCHDMLPLVGGARYSVSYQLGSYPRFDYVRV